MQALKKLAVLAATTALTACVTPTSGHDGMYASPIGDAPVTANPTPYSPALECLAGYAQAHNLAAPRIAVGRILDYTGSVSESGGRQLTQGASLMAMSAFSKAGARLVERFDTSVTELELRYANNRLIGDASNGADPSNVRHIYAGQMPGSDYTFVGGITELNTDIRSSGVDAQGGHVNAANGTGMLSGRLYVMNIALDFRLIDTRTLEVVDVISYQKQIVGRELQAGIFSFFGNTMIDISGGERALEPVQLAVRAGVERAAVEVMAHFYHVADSSACQSELTSRGDPMGPEHVRTASGAVIPQSAASAAASMPAAAPQAPAPAPRHDDQNTWNVNRDPNFSAGLRGRS